MGFITYYEGYKDLVDDFPEPTWKCLDGRVIKISDMTDSHLRNAYRSLVKHGKSSHNLLTEIKKRVTRSSTKKLIKDWLEIGRNER